MVFPRSGLATRGIVIKHDLIKSFSLPDLIEDCPVENILNAKVTFSAIFFFLLDERLYHDPRPLL